MKYSCNYPLFFVLFQFLAACTTQTTNSPQTLSQVDVIDTIIRDELTNNKVPGAVVGIFLPESEPWIKSYGNTETENGVLIDDAMLWPLRSITKSFTVSLILQLVDDGKLSLDSNISEFIPNVPNGSKVTIRQLANMSSGVGEYITQAFVDDFTKDPNRQFTIEELNNYALHEPALFEPGEKYIYINTNTNLLGKIVEIVTKQPFHQVLENRILKPLDLANTKYVLNSSEWSEPHAIGYQPAENNTLAEQPNNFSIFGPAGAMISNIYDMHAWARALARGQLLQTETQAQRLVGHKLEDGPEYDQYALGIGELNGWWGHTGEGLGFVALIMHNTAIDASVVIFMNISGVDSHVPTKLFRRLVPEIK